MKRIGAKHKRNVMLAVAVAALVTGAVVASVSANSGPHPHHAVRRTARHAAGARHARSRSVAHARGELALAASYLGVSRTDLRTQLRSGRTLAQIANSTSGKSASGLIDALVSAKAARLGTAAHAGKLSPAREQVRLADIRRRITLQVSLPRTPVDMRASAAYLGVTAAQLQDELRSGHSLARIADSTPGKSAAGLIDALVSARAAEVKAIVASAGLAPAHAGLRQRITRAIEHAPQTKS
ncbi:MAG TPA: hypothetical protein VK272_10455 [Solirubrobacteraceae bacterium]|nr:hypothetical protein [Solirubrobacteraceae bacterium]